MANNTIAGFGECTLDTCGVQQSLFGYRPSLAASGVFIALFGISLVIHLAQGFRSRQWTFASLLAIGCAVEMIGYGGRIIMNSNPWSFSGFMLQIICITIAPVFMTAAIYITLYKSIILLDPSGLATRFRPALYYLVFIPCDIISLALQAAGGALSTQSGGQSGVNISLAGLSFQVATLVIFIGLVAQYSWDFRHRSGSIVNRPDRKFKIFAIFLGLATLLILIRCAYRIYELHSGYQGTAIKDEGLFIGLESCMIVLATFCLNASRPDLALRSRYNTNDDKLDPGSEQEGKLRNEHPKGDR